MNRQSYFRNTHVGKKNLFIGYCDNSLGSKSEDCLARTQWRSVRSCHQIKFWNYSLYVSVSITIQYKRLVKVFLWYMGVALSEGLIKTDWRQIEGLYIFGERERIRGMRSERNREVKNREVREKERERK